MVARMLDMHEAPVWSRFFYLLLLFFLREPEKLQAMQAYRYFLGVSSKHPLAAASGNMCWLQ